jgi:phosphatidylserine/phosphatidylglycerophosphate/cardiolipin synthase-like enzyme
VLVVVLLSPGVLAVPSDAFGSQSPVESSTRTAQTATEAEITALYPNPTALEDSGEFVTIRFPERARLSNYSLTDGDARVSLDDGRETVSAGERITFSTAVNRTTRLTDRHVEPLSDGIQLANSGEQVQLLHNGTVVDTVSYDSAPESSVYHTEHGEWVALGATNRPVSTARDGTVETFVLPDEPERAVEFLANASQRVLLAGYTLSSEAVVETLLDAHERGVAVDILVDGDPVGGMTGRQARALNRLSRAGIRVQALSGEHARYRYHHAKYAVVDDRALVTTENWKASGIGGASSRGWGIVTDQQPIVTGLTETFQADAGWVDSIPWQEFEASPAAEDDRPDSEYPSRFDTQTHTVEETRLLVAPDNVESTLVETIRNAEESIEIKQMQIGDVDFRLLREVIRATQRGVDTRILLSGAWYAKEENRAIQQYLEEQAQTGELPLEVKIANPGGAFEKIHAKGMIVDGETTVLGSLNWNNNSMRHNREVAVLVESEGVASYFGSVFEHDWTTDGGPNEDSDSEIPVGYLLGCVLAAVVAILGARRLEFE